MTKNTLAKSFSAALSNGRKYSNPLAIVVAAALALTGFSTVSNPIIAGIGAFPNSSPEWSTGNRKGITDPITGQRLWFPWTSDNNSFPMFSLDPTTNVPSLVAADVTNPSTYQNALFSVAVDATGKVHGLCGGRGATTAFYYVRFALIRSNNQVVGHTVEAHFALPDHGHLGIDFRQNIYVFTLGGAEKIVFCYGMNTGDQINVSIYAGKSTSLTPASSSDFTGLSGSGTDELAYFVSDVAYRIHHQCHSMMAQIGSTEDLYLYFGQFNSDYAIGGSGSAYDLIAKRYVKNGTTGWNAGSTTVIDSAGSDVEPQIMDCCGTDSKAWLMRMSSSSDLTFGYMNASGAFVDNAVSSPLTGTGRAGMGVMHADDNDNLWYGANTFGSLGATPAGVIGACSAAGVHTTLTDTSAQKCAAFGAIVVPSGVIIFRYDGDVGQQVVTGLSIASSVGL